MLFYKKLWFFEICRNFDKIENFEIKIYKTVKEIENKKSDKLFLKCINYKK